MFRTFNLLSGASWSLGKIFAFSVNVVQSSSCVQLFVTPWTAACQASMSLQYLPEFAQVHVHWTSDAIQSSHLLSLSSPSALISQHQGLFQCVSSSHLVTSVLEMQLPDQSFQRMFWVDFFWDWLIWSACFPRDSEESSQFESINSLTHCLLYCPALTSVHDYWIDQSFEPGMLGPWVKVGWMWSSRRSEE